MTDPMSSPTTGPIPCRDPEFLQAYLHEQLDERDEARVQEHVGSCADCQSALAAAAGDPALWREVEAHLPHEPVDHDAESEAAAAGQTLAELREHLAPSDDPAMLGRLGHYEIRGVIGSGSTGIVLKAWEPRLDRYVAIKLMLPGYRASAAARRRFEREARAVAAVAHEHVVPIYSVDEYRGLPYIVMKYVPGESLQQRLDRTGPLDSRAVVRVGVQVARALAAAHAQGIVHRDVKPANVILDDNVDRAMVTDFGLARVADEVSLTHSGTITGTPQFMSPEQARGDVVDPRSDLFSLGSLLYAASTGQPPFRAQTLFGVIHRVSESEPRPLRELNPEIDEVVAELVGRLMQKQPDARFQTATAAADGLEAELAWLQNPTSAARPPRDWRDGEPATTSRAFGSRLLLAAMTVLAGAAAWWLLGMERESAVPSGNGSGPSTAAVFGWQDPANGAQWTRRAGPDGGTPIFEQRVTRSLPIVAGGKLQVRIESGDVVALPAAGADVRVEVIRRFATNERAAAEQLARLHAFSAAQDGDVVTLTGAFDAAAVARRGRGAFEALRYHVTVPAGVALELESAHGRIEIGDLTGDVTVHSADACVVLGRVQGEVVIEARDGSIDLGRGCTGSAELRTVRGSIAAANVETSLRAYTSGGDIRLAACEGDVYAQTSGGGIHVESLGGQTLAFSSGGDVVVRVPSAPTANCRFGAADGNVELAVNRGLAIEVAARGQEVDLPFAFRPEAAGDGTDKPWLVSRLNGGGQRIRAASTAGKVTVRALTGQGQSATGGSGQGQGEGQGGSGSGGSAQGSSGSDGSGQTGSGLGGSGLAGSGQGRSGLGGSGLGGSGQSRSGLGGSGLGGSGQVGSGLGGSGSRAGSGSASERPALATGPTPGRFAVVELPGGGAMDGYAIYLPRSHATTSEPVPVLVYLQGGFGVGGPIGDVINWGLARLVRDETDLSTARNQLLLDRFIVVCPHIREGQYHDDPEAMRSILVDVIDKHRGDPSRVYLTGLSRGGHGTWGLAARLRGTFAAIAPIGGRHEGFDDWSVLDGPAIWLSHNRGDGVVPFSSTATAVEQLEGELGVEFRRFDTLLVEGTDYLSHPYILTAPLSDTHDAWTDLYSNAPFYRWLLEHRRRPPATERRIR
ncbi:MAG: protein kinase [bacterium]|nr:protein kinase [bacterium]